MLPVGKDYIQRSRAGCRGDAADEHILLQVKKRQYGTRLSERARSKWKPADEYLAKHARLLVAVVNGILWCFLAHELLISATAPLSVLWSVWCQNNDPHAPRFRKLRSHLLRDRDNGLLAQVSCKLYRTHEEKRTLPDRSSQRASRSKPRWFDLPVLIGDLRAIRGLPRFDDLFAH